MRLVKKITHKRAIQLPQYKKIVSTFEKFKEDPNIDRHNSIKKTKDLSTLNYFLIIDYENVIKKRINIQNFIEKDGQTGNEVVNIQKLLEEKRKIEESIQDKTKKEPACFSKLGSMNEVNGCYIIGANKKSVGHIKDLDLNIKNNFIIVKLDMKKLPKEIDEMCNDYQVKTQERIKKEQEEYERFSKLNADEQDNYIRNILNEMSNTPSMIIIKDNINIYNDLTRPPGFTFFDGFSEKNLQSITNIQFLETLLSNAEEKEQYEFCAKIRDRINDLKIQNGL